MKNVLNEEIKTAMKKTIIACAMAFAATTMMPLEAGAQNPQKGDYGYLYCHMSDRGEWTAYAISRDGLHYQDIINGDSIFSPYEHARIEMPLSAAHTTARAT